MPGKHEGGIPSCFQVFDFDSFRQVAFGKDTVLVQPRQMVENSHVDQGQRLLEVLRRNRLGSVQQRPRDGCGRVRREVALMIVQYGGNSVS